MCLVWRCLLFVVCCWLLVVGCIWRWLCGDVACLLFVVDCRQTLRHHLATFKRVMVTPAVCPRLFGILTTLTFGAQRKNHIASKLIETISKKSDQEGSWSTCDQQLITNCQEHNRNGKGSASVVASIRWVLCGHKNRCYVNDGCKKKRYL